MPAFLRPFGAVLSAQAARRRAQLRNGRQAQQRCLGRLVEAYARCAAGREAGLSPTSSYKDYAERMPTRTYEGFAPWISRVLLGERDILWPGECAYFAVSSGTTAGRTKHLPVTAAMISHFSRTGLESLLCATHRLGDAGLFSGRQLFLGGATRLEPVRRPEGSRQGWAGDLSGITALNMPGWVDSFLYEPGRDIAQMSDWPAKIDAIAKRTLDRDIRLLAGIPSWILVLAEELRRRAAAAGRPVRTLQELWPHLRCLVHGGVPIGPYVEELRAALGENILFHEVYPASEGFIAVQDAEPEAGLRLLTEAGIFYEFAPLEKFDDSNPEQLGEHAVPLEGVETGRDYVLIMSTPAGLSRYIIGDVVRFTSTDIPRLVYAGRTKLQLSAFGEHVIEKELTDSLLAVAKSENLRVADFHVAPVFVDHRLGIERGRHEWILALRAQPDDQCLERLPLRLDKELALRNDDYEAKRKGGGLSLPLVTVVNPDTFVSWQKANGKFGGQSKFPRCRSDRQIADCLLLNAPAKNPLASADCH
jgi:hypothetical protein